jgi:pimeloyl-ACP methyl ester carboxylesterase/LysM repeat protein
VTLGRDRTDNDNNPLVSSEAENEHGTAVWSLIGAIAGNNIGIDGINDRAPVWLGRASGSGQWDLSITDFVRDVKSQGQRNAIANLSLDLTQVDAEGTVTTRYELTPRERAALEYARQNGVLLVVAAGNDGGVMSVLGQASQEFDNIMTVGAFDGVRRSSYSSYGYGLDAVVAEGENDLDALTGTSFAAAKATGMASVVWESNPELSDRQVIDILKQSAIDVNLPGWDRKTGFGLLNLDKAVQLAKETAPQSSTRAEFATPETWGYEGLVKPMERATAQQFNGKSYDWKPYTIKAGDTLSEIAKETMGSAAPDYYKFIAKHNKIDNPNVIYVGQKIEVPVEVSASDGGANPIEKPEQQSPNSISIGGHNIAGKFYPVYDKYQSAIGKPTSDVINYSGNVSYQLFERGSIVSSPKGTFPIYGSIRQEYRKTGGLDGRLGVPKSGEIDRGNGNKIQYFEGGHIYWNGNKATAYQEPGKPSKPDNTNLGGGSNGGNTNDSNELGSLSEKYETGNRGPGTIGNDPTGGWSYGTYQLATKPGSLAGFLNSEIASKWSSELKPLTPGTKAFNNKWKEIASKDAEEFSAAQHEYIKITHYDPLANKLKKTLNLDVNKHSKALQNVIWSTAVQHGANTKLVNNALKGKNISRMSESELINAIYAERGKKDSAGNLVYFSSSPRDIQQSVANRFVDERSDALAMLQKPSNSGNSEGGTKPAKPGNSGDNSDKETFEERPRDSGKQSPISGDIDPRPSFGELNIWRYDTNGRSAQKIEGDKETVIVIHGWQGSDQSSQIEKLAKEASESDGVQVLALDWRSIARAGLDGSDYLPPYNTAKWIAPVAQWAKDRLVELGIAPDRLTLVGHSLGTYVSAEIARKFGQVKNLVALDPAFPAHNIGTGRLPSGVPGYDMDRNTDGTQSPADFRKVAANSLAFVASNSSNPFISDSPSNTDIPSFIGGLSGDSNQAASAHDSFVIQFLSGELEAHSRVVDVFTDALDKKHLKLPNLTLPNHEDNWYSDNGRKLNSLANKLPDWLKGSLDLNHHEGRISATSTGDIQGLRIVVDSSGTEQTIWT